MQPDEPVVEAEYNTPCYGVACVEGVPDGSMPRRQFAPGGMTFAATPFSLKIQMVEAPGHDGAMIAGRVDAMWRDGALIRWVGCMDSAGVVGREAERLVGGKFVTGVSILADDIEEADLEYVYPQMAEPVELLEELGESEGEMALDVMPEPTMEICHAGRVRSLTIVAEPAFVECFIALGESPHLPPMSPPDEEVVATAPAMSAATWGDNVVTAAGYTITIPEVWPESWFEEPTELPPFGALHITASGRVFGLLAPAQVDHRAFRAQGKYVTAPKGVDYSEFQNKPALVAGADGGVYRINAGAITFDCGHASPVDPRRADPAWASQHYENSCSIAARVRVGENRYGTWVAGALLHGIDADTVERMMACALSGDWQGGRLKAALLVPVEGFPRAATASVRVREDAIVASSVPVRFEEPEPPVDLGALFDLIASANGRDPATRLDEYARERFADYVGERVA